MRMVKKNAGVVMGDEETCEPTDKTAIFRESSSWI